MKKKSIALRILILSAVAAGIAAVSVYPAYLLSKYAFTWYFDSWGNKLVNLEKRGLLSKEFGAAWKDILQAEAMESRAQKLIDPVVDKRVDSVLVVDGVFVKDYPSLSIISRLNRIHQYSNSIRISDRKDRLIAEIRTDHTRGGINEFPKTLVTALTAAEEKTFFTNKQGFEFDSYVRAALMALYRAATTFSKPVPRGTSTITQQVAKLFISDIDEEGRRVVSRSVDRKIREMRLAAAIRKMYPPEKILEVYLNHCVTSDHGLIGCKDIARGLFHKEPLELSETECIYLARMVKWGRNIHAKIARQCRIDMPRMARALGWDETKQERILSEIDTLTFKRPQRVATDHGALIDLANEFWLKVLARNGMARDQLGEMDFIDPNSLVRRKGNVSIRLSIDLPLQRALKRMVDTRGYGPDTVIYTDARIGSQGRVVSRSSPPQDTLRHLSVLGAPQTFYEPDSAVKTILRPGDTLVTNIRYMRTGPDTYRRSVFYYARRPVKVNGQYFAYAIMDSRTGKLLAYYSRDRLGSRVASLLSYRTPNGSSTAKPIFNALNFDFGTFEPYEMWSDLSIVDAGVPWKRSFIRKGDRTIGVTFENTAVRGRGYPVNNHDRIFEGCQYVFDLLATSNNILGVETAYRLNGHPFTAAGGINNQALPLVQFLHRINAFSRVKNDLRLHYVTGVRAYKELARIVGVNIDTMESFGTRVPVSDSLYSVALGTLEMTLYEQLHLFNCLHNNDLIERPADHPSLVIEEIAINSDTISVADTIRRYHPFSDINRLRPTYLGLHKRLVSNAADGLTGYDIAWTADNIDSAPAGTAFSPDALLLDEPLANFAKSGTTDDVLRPFNVDVISTKRTCFGLWNAVIRIDLSRLSKEVEPEVRDITLACIGECNQRYTGAADGKSLHKFASAGLLKTAGIQSPNGFFAEYESYLRRATPDSLKNCAKASSPSSPATTATTAGELQGL